MNLCKKTFGKTLAQDNSALHEVGHLLGIGDKYIDKNGAYNGRKSNILGNYKNKNVE